MFPNNRLSTHAAFAPWREPVRGAGDLLVDYEVGGIAINDGSLGLNVKQWECRAVRVDTFGDPQWSVDVRADGGWVQLFLQDDQIHEVSLAFDGNMSPIIAYRDDSGSYIRWFDHAESDFALIALPAGTQTPRCCIDEKRPALSAISDAVVAYVRDGALYFRLLRERFELEHVLKSGLGPGAKLICLQMNMVGRLQWQFRGIPDDGQVHVAAAPLLADVVGGLFARSGVSPLQLDLTQLYSKTIEGYRIASEGGADVMVAPLQRGWFFDPYEADGKLCFQMRQQSQPQGELPPDALVEQDGPALSIERAQEAELLRKVNLTTIDSSIDYVPNTQTAERRSGTVLAIGEQSSELPITCGPDFAATVARRQLTVAWGEMQTYKFSLPIQFSYLTPSDVVTVRDERGRLHRMRVMQIEEDGGELIIEATEHAPWAYDAQATGVQAAPPISTAPGLVGDTEVIILNLPVLRDQDDELGVYVCALGTGSGWRGGEVQLSTDGGLSVGQFLQVTFPANAGRTLSPLVAEVSAEYASYQALAVSLRWGAESITRDQLLRYGNLAALQHPGGAWELIQFETATETAPGEFLLSGLLRGRYASGTGAVPANARFVVIDDNLFFAQLQQWMIGQSVSYRGVSYGQDSDESAWATHTVAAPASQTEWPVYSVQAVRDGAGNVTVSWVGRGRLGVETAPRHSKYFTGYRVIYSDGFTADTADSVHTRAGAPAGATVQVAAINSITGPGPASEAIPT